MLTKITESPRSSRICPVLTLLSSIKELYMGENSRCRSQAVLVAQRCCRLSRAPFRAEFEQRATNPAETARGVDELECQQGIQADVLQVSKGT